jgi:hypothetical protein
MTRSPDSSGSAFVSVNLRLMGFGFPIPAIMAITAIPAISPDPSPGYVSIRRPGAIST